LNGNDVEAAISGDANKIRLWLRRIGDTLSSQPLQSQGPNFKRGLEAIMTHHFTFIPGIGKKLLPLALASLGIVVPIAVGIANSTPRQTASASASVTQSATKYVLGDLRIQGEVDDRDGVRSRVLKEWKDLEYDNLKQLTDAVMISGIRNDFWRRGYVEAVASDPEPHPLVSSNGRQSILLVAEVSEGEQFRLGDVTFQNESGAGALSVDQATLRDQLNLRDGDILDADMVRDALGKIRKLYANKGYSESVGTPLLHFDRARHMIALTFAITEGPQTK
jgi:Surface antigen variable number repeat